MLRCECAAFRYDPAAGLYLFRRPRRDRGYHMAGLSIRCALWHDRRQLAVCLRRVHAAEVLRKRTLWRRRRHHPAASTRNGLGSVVLHHAAGIVLVSPVIRIDADRLPHLPHSLGVIRAVPAAEGCQRVRHTRAGICPLRGGLICCTAGRRPRPFACGRWPRSAGSAGRRYCGVRRMVCSAPPCVSRRTRCCAGPWP